MSEIQDHQDVFATMMASSVKPLVMGCGHVCESDGFPDLVVQICCNFSNKKKPGTTHTADCQFFSTKAQESSRVRCERGQCKTLRLLFFAGFSDSTESYRIQVG